MFMIKARFRWGTDAKNAVHRLGLRRMTGTASVHGTGLTVITPDLSGVMPVIIRWTELGQITRITVERTED